MSKEIIYSDKAPAPIGPYSQAVKCNGMLFVSGQIPIDQSSGDLVTSSIEAETDQVMKNLEYILAEAGCTFEHVVKCSIFLTDMGTFPRVNEVYGRYFPSAPPARETVEVSQLPKGVHVEISCIAVINA